ncbi:hypothetical protein [Mycobacterium sp.]|uniref:hypothetical protein n=1 Tax=Mycobacterium sp. TaxID=1785 RepID=UPI002D2B75F9|nr:hypothetical protein [Mycobacterium sp.]HZA10092.1 hypothetical protein [Mycobacterium sp.]
MADNEQDKPPKHEARAQPADDEPMVDTREPDPETPKSGIRNKNEWQVPLITAAISAFAALTGALVGGISSYIVAQSNNTAQANEALIARKATTYADYITYQSDLLRADNELVEHFKSNPSDTAAMDPLVKTWTDNYGKWLHTDFIVKVVASPQVSSTGETIHTHNDRIRDLLNHLIHEVNSHEPIDQSALVDLHAEFVHMSDFVNDFTDHARADTTPPKGGLFS